MYAAAVADREIGKRMESLKSELVAFLEETAGRRIRYGSISPSIFQYVEIRDLAILEDSGEPLLSVRQLRVRYDIFSLLRGAGPISCLREIRISNTAFSIDWERDKAQIELVRTLLKPGGASGHAGSARFLGTLTGANIDVSLRSADASVALSKLFFSIQGREETVDVTLRGNVTADLSDKLHVSSALKAQGSMDPGFQSADVKTQLIGLSTNFFEAGRQTFQVAWKGNALSLRKIQDSAPLDLRVDADLSTGDLEIAFLAEKFQPSRLVRLRGQLAAYNTWLAATYSGKGTVRYGLKGGALEYGAEISAVLKDQLPIHDVRLAGAFRGDTRRIEFTRIAADTPRGSAEFVGDLPFSNMYPQGTFTLKGVELVRGERLDAVLAVIRDPAGLRVQSENVTFGGQAFDSLAVTVFPDKDRLRLEARLSFAGSAEEDALQIRGEARLGGKPRFEGIASFTKTPLDQLLRLALGTEELPQELSLVRPLLPRLRLDAEVSFQTDLSEIHLAGDSLLLSQADVPGNTARLSMRLDNRKLAVSSYAVDWNGLSLAGALTGELTRQEQLSFNTDFRFRGIPYTLEGSYSPALGLYLRGSYGLDATMILIGQGGVSLEAKAENFPIPLPDAVYTVSFDLEGDFPDNGNWVLNDSTFTLVDFPILESRHNLLDIAFSANPRRINLSRIRFSDSLSVIEGGGTVAFPDGLRLSGMSPADLTAQAELNLKAVKGTESFAFTGSYRKEKMEGTLAFQGLPLKRIGTFAVTGDLTGTARLSGSLEDPQADIEAALVAGRIGPDPFRLSGRVVLSHKAADLKDLDVSWLSHSLQNASGTIGLDHAGAFRFNARYSGEYFGDRVDVTGSLSGNIQDFGWDSLLEPLMDRKLEGRLALERIQVKREDVAPWEMRVRGDGSVLYVDGGPGDKIHGSLDQLGEFQLLLESPDPQGVPEEGALAVSPLPVQGSARGNIAAAKIDATVDITAVDLKVLNAVVRTEIFRVSTGNASGRLTIKGPLGDPDFGGALTLSGTYMRSKYSPDEIGPLRTSVSFNGKSFSTTQFSTFAGKAALSVAASFSIDHWVPITFDLKLTADGTPGVHMKTKFGTVQLDGVVTGQVKVAGNDRITTVKGGIQANDCQITLGKWEGGRFIPEDPPTVVELAVETGKRVEFLWPSEAWPVLRTYAAAGGRGKVDVTYRGDTGAYTVIGNAEVQGGEIYYFDRSFYLRSGSIAFRENEQDFDPRIKALAEIREWDQKSNENVKIYLEADGKLSQFVPRLRSDPSHSDVEILSMIGSPILSRVEEDQNPIASAAMLSADIFGRLQVLRPFERSMRELLNLDVFSFRTQVLQNVLAQKVLGSTTNPLDNTSLSLGKYLGNDLYLEMMVRLQEQNGVSGSNLLGVDPEVELNMEWTTPFFLLEWSFLPKTPEKMFLTDNSISFKWRFAY